MYDIDWLKQQSQKDESLKYVYFWGHTPKNKSVIDAACFSQWFESPFTVGGVTYKTAEHWMMAHKAITFDDQDILQQILACDKPAEAKKLGRSVANYNDEIWKNVSFSLVVTGNIHKFSQHADMKEYLLNTGDRVLVEASPVDAIWGIGLSRDSKDIHDVNKWRGTNLLGFALMEARDALRKTIL